MRQGLTCTVLSLLILGAAPNASAQLIAAKDGPIVYGHYHVATADIEAHKRFWAGALGGTSMKFGANNAEIVKFPNVLIFFRDQKPTGGTVGTTVNHIGMSVPNLRAVVNNVKANGFKMVTRTEVAATVQVTDDIAAFSPTTSIAFAMGPDEVKVELVENQKQTLPVMLHHLHFAGQQNAEMRDWYVRMFGAKLGNSATFVTATLPDVTLGFNSSPTPVVGTAGRAVDHIGFEVRNLEAFIKDLEAMGIKPNVPYRTVPALGLSIAFITDPWGTSIELTEGLSKVE